MRRKLAAAIVGSALLAQPSLAFAEVSANPNELVGSDTFNQMMDNLLVDLAVVDGAGIETYAGLGSSAGERQLIGNPSGTEPACVDDNGGENSGCQEIAPMSRAMGSAICAAGNSEAVEEAEGLAVCRDGIVVITDNATLGEYGDSPAACAAYAGLANTDNAGPPTPNFPDRGVGNLRDQGVLSNTGYVVGAGFAPGEAWKDAVRIIYTGCQQGDGDCVTASGTGNTSSGVPSRPRIDRCDHPVRRELLANLSNVAEGVDCDGAAGDLCEVDNTADGVDDTGLRHAFRRDDASGTTGVFLELIGVRANLTGRSKIPATLTEAGSATGCSPGAPPASRVLITPIPEHFAFCDGGMLENWFPDCHDSELIPIGGDPIRKDCAASDDLCGPDGKAAVVQAIKSTRGDTPYPTHQCTRGLFGKQNYLTSALPVCPDGSVPSAGQCKLPYWRNPSNPSDVNFNCVNPASSRPATVPITTDGRAYNHAMRSAAGVVDMPDPGNLPEVASWRQNMVNIVNAGIGLIQGLQYAAGDYVCTEADATRNIGCLIANSTCSIGFAGREAAYSAANDAHLGNEPFQLQDSGPTDAAISAFQYPFARELYLNAIGGFENITADCMARGESAAYCAEQVEIAMEFYETGTAGNVIAGLCRESGFIPLSHASCVGAAASAGCGAPASQPLSACEPM